MSEEGWTSLMELKFYWSYNSLDMSGPRLDKSKKHLLKPVKRPGKSGGPDLLWDRSNQSDWCAIPV
jgi:hypothetical protein